MGEVYKAHDARLNRTVAIKVLAATVATPDRVRQLEDEARAASALTHPNILTIYDVGPQWIAMEWIDGGSLRDLMNAGRVFVVVHAEIEYRAPARYGETLEIETTISEMNPAAMTFSHVVRERQSRRLVVEGAARLAVTDGNGHSSVVNMSLMAGGLCGLALVVWRGQLRQTLGRYGLMLRTQTYLAAAPGEVAGQPFP